MKLLDEANGIPVMVAVFLPSGHVAIQEFTDASLTLDLNVSTQSVEGSISLLHQPASMTDADNSLSNASQDDGQHGRDSHQSHGDIEIASPDLSIKSTRSETNL